MADDTNKGGKEAGEKTSPYPAPGSGEHTKPVGGEPSRQQVDYDSTKAPGVPTPQPGGPDAPAPPGQKGS